MLLKNNLAPYIRQIPELFERRIEIGDELPPMMVGYGLRQLRVEYKGALINLRRSLDNASRDFYPAANGELDPIDLLIFAAGSNLFCPKWYDQSGNGNDAVQATAANQPQLALNVQNGHPGLSFNGSQWLVTASYPTQAQPVSVAIVAQTTSATQTGQSMTGTSLSNSPIIAFHWSSANTITLVDNSLTVSATAADSVFHSAQGVFSGAASVLNVDGAETTGTVGIIGQGSTLGIGSWSTGSQTMIGNIGEAIWWAAANTFAQRALIRANQKAYWGTP